MNKKYENIRVSVVQIGSKNVMLFSGTSNEAEIEYSFDNQLQTELLAWLVKKHIPLYQGKEGETSYAGNVTPIHGDISSEVMKLVQKLRKIKPSGSTNENIRKFMLDMAEEAERLEYIFCTS
ncbi:MAG: hypothetical protein GEU26_11010 [Nitrososphaeraceae archaeon]|nr:hypothetical protein [Nitrososphaeraceae archaeon]